MAKKKRSKGSNTHKTRVHPIDARANALRSFLGLTPGPNLIDQRRVTYSPTPITQKTFEASPQVYIGPKRAVPAPASKTTYLHENSRIVTRPEKTICSTRQARKEVIHAFNYAGKSGQKKSVRTETSNIHCKD